MPWLGPGSTPTIGSQLVPSRSDANVRMSWLDTINKIHLHQEDLRSSDAVTAPCQRGAASQKALADNASVYGPVSWPNGENAAWRGSHTWWRVSFPISIRWGWTGSDVEKKRSKVDFACLGLWYKYELCSGCKANLHFLTIGISFHSYSWNLHFTFLRLTSWSLSTWTISCNTSRLLRCLFTKHHHEHTTSSPSARRIRLRTYFRFTKLRLMSHGPSPLLSRPFPPCKRMPTAQEVCSLHPLGLKLQRISWMMHSKNLHPGA